MHNFGLLAQPFGEAIHALQIIRVSHRTGITTAQRIINDVNTGQIIGRPIRGFTKIHPLIKIFNKPVIESEARQHRRADNCQCQHGQQKRLALGDNHISQPLHGLTLPLDRVTGLHRQDAKQGGEQGHR